MIYRLVIWINLLTAIFYLMYGIMFRWNREGAGQYVMNFFVMLLCPVAGAVYLLVSTCIRYLFMHREADLEGILFSRDKVEALVPADEETESNIVPMEEALLISDKSSLRQYMLNVIRGDVEDCLGAFAQALDSDDTETAHYAASVLSQALNDFRIKVQLMYTEIMQEEDAKKRCGLCLTLTAYITHILEQHAFSFMEQSLFVKKLDEVCELVYADSSGELDGSYMESVIRQLIEVREYDRAKLWCDRAQERYPLEAFAYTCPMKLYFIQNDRDKLFAAARELRQLDIPVDNQTWEMVRMFGRQKGDWERTKSECQ